MLSRAWTAFAVLSLAGVARAQQTPRCPDVADAAGLLRCARARSATVVQAEQALKAVQARRITAGFVLPANPTLALEAGHRRLADGSSDLDRGLLLSQTFEIAGQRSLRLDVADAQEAAAQAALAAARREVAARTLRQIDEIWRARATLGFARRERDVARALARVAQARARQGVGAGLEVDLAEAAVVEAGRAERQAESTLREAEAALAARVGQDVKLAPGGPLPRPAPPASALAELEASGLRGSAEVQARRAEAAVARAEVALRRRERVPDVTVGVGVRYEELAHIVGAQLSVPLPIVRRNQGEIAEGEVRAAAADAAGHRRRCASTWRCARPSTPGSRPTPPRVRCRPISGRGWRPT